jgi:hypothetical protein
MAGANIPMGMAGGIRLRILAVGPMGVARLFILQAAACLAHAMPERMADAVPDAGGISVTEISAKRNRPPRELPQRSLAAWFRSPARGA